MRRSITEVSNSISLTSTALACAHTPEATRPIANLQYGNDNGQDVIEFVHYVLAVSVLPETAM